MKVQGCSVAPQAFVELIERFVQSRTSSNIQSLQVEIVGGDVVITGYANTYYVKQLASHAVMSAVDEHVSLTNDIEVY